MSKVMALNLCYYLELWRCALNLVQSRSLLVQLCENGGHWLLLAFATALLCDVFLRVSVCSPGHLEALSLLHSACYDACN